MQQLAKGKACKGRKTIRENASLRVLFILPNLLDPSLGDTNAPLMVFICYKPRTRNFFIVVMVVWLCLLFVAVMIAEAYSHPSIKAYLEFLTTETLN